jgi:hypothetical protein
MKSGGKPWGKPAFPTCQLWKIDLDTPTSLLINISFRTQAQAIRRESGRVASPAYYSVSKPASIHAAVPPVTLKTFLNPAFSRMLVPKLER